MQEISNYNMTKTKMMEKCNAFMERLAELLKDSYTFDRSPFSPDSSYLAPKGHEDENTWYSKPEFSFRCSDHWNWYANVKKCSEYYYVQCYNKDVFWPEKRVGPKATKLRYACQVGFFSDNCFRCVYGEKYDRHTKTYVWVEATPEEYIDTIRYLLDQQKEEETFDAEDI